MKHQATWKYLLLLSTFMLWFAAAVGSEPEDMMQRRGRILNGNIVSSRRDYPYAARITQPLFKKFSFVTQCGGALVAARWVLTTGICLSNKLSRIFGFSKSKKTATYLEVTLGSLSFLKPGDGQFTTLGTAVFHPNFQDQGSSLSNDIGLVQLKNAAPLGQNIQIVSLPPDSWTKPADGTSVEIIGWGVYRFSLDQDGVLSGDISGDLRTGSQVVTADQSCRDSNFKYPFNSDQMMCLGKISALSQVPCQGDEGGPVIQTTVTGKILMGAISKIGWETTECLKRDYTIITKVHPYLSWIRQTTA